MAINPAIREQIKRKFEISFVLAKEHIPFLKYPAIHDLEERHGVVKNRDSAHNFVHYIAESQRQHLYTTLASSHFYSILMDSSTDKERVENELFVILFVKKLELKTTARYYCMLEPRKTDSFERYGHR